MAQCIQKIEKLWDKHYRGIAATCLILLGCLVPVVSIIVSNVNQMSSIDANSLVFATSCLGFLYVCHGACVVGLRYNKSFSRGIIVLLFGTQISFMVLMGFIEFVIQMLVN